MKAKTTIFITRVFAILLIFILLGFNFPERKIYHEWKNKTLSTLDKIEIENKVTSEQLENFKLLIANRDKSQIKKRLDSLFNKNHKIIYIEEEYNYKTKQFTRTEKYFAEDKPYFRRFMRGSSNNLDSVQYPNVKIKNDNLDLIEKQNLDEHLKEYLAVIYKHFDTLSYFSFVRPVIEKTVLHPGCSGTSRIIEAERKKLEKKNKKPIMSDIYRIETLINNDSVFVSLQVPKKMKPFVYIRGRLF